MIKEIIALSVENTVGFIAKINVRMKYALP
jgi:hypothetical protein